MIRESTVYSPHNNQLLAVKSQVGDTPIYGHLVQSRIEESLSVISVITVMTDLIPPS